MIMMIIKREGRENDERVGTRNHEVSCSEGMNEEM